jgi:RND family efflux transporter MFP subunit
MPESGDLASLKIDRDARRSVSPLLTGLLVLIVLAATGGLGAWWLLGAPTAIEVRTAAARAIRLDQPTTVLNASGYVTARRMATVSSKVTGRVVDVLIEEGMEVEEGQLLAVLDASNTAANLRLAESELEAARATLAETRVRRDEAEVELQRIRPLAERGVVAAAELDRVQANYDSLEARIVQQQDQVEVAASRVALWQQELADREIRAPFAGVVVSKNAQPGEMISPMSAGGSFTRTGIGTIVDMESLEIEVDVNESYINRVSPGQRVEATLDAYTDWQIPASVIAIVPTADRQRATVKVRIAFDQLDPRILPDMGVKVAFRDLPGEVAADSGDSAPSGVVVPTAALRRDGGRDVVFVVAGGIVERRQVGIGSRNENEAVINSGLAAGERVVVEGPVELRDGDLVSERNP